VTNQRLLDEQIAVDGVVDRLTNLLVLERRVTVAR
jgi:hypothetical protein